MLVISTTYLHITAEGRGDYGAKKRCDALVYLLSLGWLPATGLPQARVVIRQHAWCHDINGASPAVVLLSPVLHSRIVNWYQYCSTSWRSKKAGLCFTKWPLIALPKYNTVLLTFLSTIRENVYSSQGGFLSLIFYLKSSSFHSL